MEYIDNAPSLEEVEEITDLTEIDGIQPSDNNEFSKLVVAERKGT